jgi:hypothetical protein
VTPRCSCGKPFSEDGGAEGVCECCTGCATAPEPTSQQADAYAEKVLDAIPDDPLGRRRYHASDRKAVASALRALHRAKEGLREAGQHSSLCGVLHTSHARRYADARDDALDDLRRVGRLYGVPAP